MRTLYIEYERDWPVGLGSTIAEGQTDRHTHTFFLKHILDCGCDVEWKIIKKSKSKILTVAILPSLLMSLESKSVLKMFVYVCMRESEWVSEWVSERERERERERPSPNVRLNQLTGKNQVMLGLVIWQTMWLICCSCMLYLNPWWNSTMGLHHTLPTVFAHS